MKDNAPGGKEDRKMNQNTENVKELDLDSMDKVSGGWDGFWEFIETIAKGLRYCE